MFKAALIRCFGHVEAAEEAENTTAAMSSPWTVVMVNLLAKLSFFFFFTHPADTEQQTFI